MNLQKAKEKYAELLIASSINLKKGQELCINAQIEAADFVRMVSRAAFKHGAKDVVVMWGDEQTARIRYDNADISCYENVYEWDALRSNLMARKDFAFLHLVSSNPDAFAGIDPRKPAAARKAMYAATKEYRAKMDIDGCQWCIAGVPSKAWAQKVFPNETPDNAVEKLWEAVLKTARVDDDNNPIEEWEKHKKAFKLRREWLNSLNLKELHYKNSKGTDITIGLTDDYLFEGGGASTPEGHYFFPNVPTEEIFTSPHSQKADGTVVNALPLIYQGNIIDNFSITFKDGRICDFTAEKGYDVLKSLIETDEGSHHLGEVALIPYDSPISNMGMLFYDTLYDENASCHFAFGGGFPPCLKGGAEMPREKSIELGVNQSAAHVDFMIGTPDLEITGTDKSGNLIPIFKNGSWAAEV